MRVFGRGALSVCSNIWRRIRCTLSSAYKKLLRHKKIEADTVDDGAPVNFMGFIIWATVGIIIIGISAVVSTVCTFHDVSIVFHRLIIGVFLYSEGVRLYIFLNTFTK